jgi:hypothetical protein
MRTTLLCCAGLAVSGGLGCAGGTSFVHADTTTLGRVVIYRNGVAYFERYAHVADDKLTLAVPADKVDDFLKSLNVVDAKTGEPAPIAYPTDPSKEGAGLIDMQIKLPGTGPHELKLSYVTEAPAWKPSYRVVLGDANKVELVGWAIVDNTSGEDWKSVRLGVGASSAMSFRFDLRSVRLVERETLQSNDLFAQAPPTGEATYGGPTIDATKKLVGELHEEAIAKADEDGAPEPPADAASTPTGGSFIRNTPSVATHATAAGAPPPPSASARAPQPAGPPRVVGARERRKAPEDAVVALAQRLRGATGQVVVEGYAASGDADREAAALERANRVRDKLVRNGVDASRVVAVGKGAETGHEGGARVLESPMATPAGKDEANKSVAVQAAAAAAALDPIGTSHFESQAALTVTRGTSAMVSILHTAAEGEVVYLYDPESARGNAQFAFRSLRLRNPTDSQLESGPVTVFGEGRFVGEGLSEPIPAHQVAFVPFALDRQVVIDRTEGERDEIARILTVQRGVFSTQMQHIRRTAFTLHNRLPNKTVVYVRHSVPASYRTSKAPGDPEHVSGADMYRVEVDGYGKQEIVLEDSTPVYKSTDIRDPAGMQLVRVFLTGAAAGPLKGHVEELVNVQKEIGDDETRIATLRDQMNEYRARMDELHAQIVTLRAVKTAGPLMTSLEKKLQEVSDKLSKSTIDVVALQEKLMLARIKFQDGVAELSLEPHDKTSGATSVANK